MKYYPNNLEQVLANIRKGEITSVLIYGPDRGMIQELVKKAASVLSYKITPHEYETPEGLFNSLNNMSFFAEKELLKVEFAGKFDEGVQQIITASHIHFPIFTCGELTVSSGIRKFFENERNLASIACYPDEEKSIRQVITNVVLENKKHISPDALEFLINKLHGDRVLILNELAKLLCYVGGEDKIILEHCRAIISDSIESQPDILCIYFARKKGELYLKELNNLLENSISVIWILRALARFYQNLLIVKLQEADGVSIETAVARFKPPIFYKYQASFKEIAMRSSISQLSEVLHNLTIAEIEAKNNQIPLAVMDNLFIKHFASLDKTLKK